MKNIIRRPVLCHKCNMYILMTKDEYETLGCPKCDMNILSNDLSNDLEPDNWNFITDSTHWSFSDRSCSIKQVYDSELYQDHMIDNNNKIVRFVCISDTHCLHRDVNIPECDYLIHSGDITNYGEPDVMNDFMDWLRELKKNKIVRKECIVVPGNHDVTLYPEFMEKHYWRYFWDIDNIDNIYTTNIIILRDKGIELDGIRIFGSPWVKPASQWAYCSSNLNDKYSRIPMNTDILITHTPAFGKGDNSTFGSSELTNRINIVKPLINVMGHVHFGYGIIFDDTTYINAALANSSATQIINKPITFDLYLN